MSKQPKLGILAGGGGLAEAVIEHCAKTKRPYHVITFAGQPAPQHQLPAGKHNQLKLLKLKQVIKALKQAKVEQVVLVGKLNKASLFNTTPDSAAFGLLSKLNLKHDDALLRAAIDYLASFNLKVVGVDELLPELLMPAGCLSNTEPNKQAMTDIAAGTAILNHLSKFDLGQAAVVQNGIVLGVEGVEGTDELIKRCAKLQSRGSKAVLVKLPKIGQTRKADLPTIGLETIELLAENGYAGVALAAGGGFFVQSEAALKLANRRGLFVYGVEGKNA